MPDKPTNRESEHELRDRMRVPLRAIVAAISDLAARGVDFEQDGVAEMNLHRLMSDYIVARAKRAGVGWSRFLSGEPLDEQWSAALLQRERMADALPHGEASYEDGFHRGYAAAIDGSVEVCQRMREEGDSELRQAIARIKALRSPSSVADVLPHHAWHEDDGPALWWRFPVEQPPYVGSPLDDDFPGEYVTHWTRIVVPRTPHAKVCDWCGESGYELDSTGHCAIETNCMDRKAAKDRAGSMGRTKT